MQQDPSRESRLVANHCAVDLRQSEKLLEPESPSAGFLVEFDDLCYSVSATRRASPKKILYNVFGHFRPNRLTAIIGPSGAGKSTLLGIVSSLKTTNVRGLIRVNGAEGVNCSLFRKRTCFIPQEFALQPLLTTRETLRIACLLKLDRSDKSRAPSAVVVEVAENLGLANSLDTLVQNLSGGERKRLSIGIEIITKPSVLMLDEPTSGLDSASSNQVITLLHDIAKSGCTVVCAIHQPSCRMISQFDDVLVIDKGRSYYCGPWEEILTTFGTAGFICPQFYNIAEFVLEVITEQRCGDLELLKQISQDKYIEWKNQNSAERIDANSCPSPAKNYFENDIINMPKPKGQNLSIWQEQTILFWRAMICMKRDNTMTKLRFMAHVVVAFLLGVVFYDAGNNASRTNSNVASIFFILLFLYFSSSMPAVQMFPIEAAVFLREYLNNWYRLSSYYIVKIVSDSPLQILCPSIFIIITYYMTGQPMECQRFFQTWIICVLTTVLGQSSGILTGVMFNTQIGVFLIPALSMPMILFAGFFLKFSEIPVYLQPMCAISFFRYAFEGILQAIYNDREKLPCNEVFCLMRLPDRILRSMDMPSMQYSTSVLMLCIWIVMLQILIFSVLKWKAYVATK